MLVSEPTSQTGALAKLNNIQDGLKMYKFSILTEWYEKVQMESVPKKNPKFNDYIDVIYPKELEIKDTTDATKWANYEPLICNPKFNDYIDVIYPKELEIKDTTDATKWANYLDLYLEFDEDGKRLFFFTRLYASVMTLISQ